MYIFAHAGKQYLAQNGSKLTLPKLEGEIGQILEVALLSDVSENEVSLTSGKLKVKILEHLKGPKVIAFKKLRRKGYERKKGFREQRTQIEVIGI